MSDYELVHYGVKGMKWGVRKAEIKRGSGNKRSTKSKEEPANEYKKERARQKRYIAAKRVVDGASAFLYAKGRYGDALATRAIGKAMLDRNYVKKGQRDTGIVVRKKREKAEKRNRTGAEVAKKVLATAGKLYLTDMLIFGGAGAKAVKAGAKYVKNAALDKMFNASVLDVTGKVIYRYNM